MKSTVDLIFATYAGSHLYGTDRPDSDVDIRGVCYPTVESVLGLSKFEQFNPSVSSAVEWSMENFEIESDDVVVYALPKFFDLLLGANPNIVELLFAPDEAILYHTPLWDRIVANRHLFLSQKIIHTFSGYAISQLRRIRRHRRWLGDPPIKPDPADYSAEFVDGAWKWREPVKDEIINVIRTQDFDELDSLYRRAARRKEYDADLREWQHYQTWQKNRNPARAKLEERYGYDTKHASHLYRLAIEATCLLTMGEIEFPFDPYTRGQLQAVLNGKVSYEEVVEFAEEIDERLKGLPTALPKKPDRKGAERLLMEVLRKWL